MDRDLVAGMVFHHWQEFAEELVGLAGSLEHLPVGGQQFCAGHGIPFKSSIRQSALSIQPLLVRASTPGSFLPSRNSSEAPPPVEMWVILSATPAWRTAETEAPPPAMEGRPRLRAPACASLNVPLEKAATSNTPIGPFQMMVRAVETS